MKKITWLLLLKYWCIIYFCFEQLFCLSESFFSILSSMWFSCSCRLYVMQNFGTVLTWDFKSEKKRVGHEAHKEVVAGSFPCEVERKHPISDYPGYRATRRLLSNRQSCFSMYYGNGLCLQGAHGGWWGQMLCTLVIWHSPAGCKFAGWEPCLCLNWWIFWRENIKGSGEKTWVDLHQIHVQYMSVAHWWCLSCSWAPCHRLTGWHAQIWSISCQGIRSHCFVSV